MKVFIIFVGLFNRKVSNLTNIQNTNPTKKITQILKGMSFTFIFLYSFIVMAFFPYRPENVELCDKYEEYFGGNRSVFTAEDSTSVLKYVEKLYKLYSNNKDVYISDTRPSPYDRLYDMKNYDTSLLFKVLRLFNEDSISYKNEIGIRWSFAQDIIINDAVIRGNVVDKINDHKECRYFSTTYFVEVDTIIHSYFQLNISDTVMIHVPLIGYTYCEQNKPRGYGAITHMKDYQIGETGQYFYLDRDVYVRHQKRAMKDSTRNYKDPFCYNSFFRNPGN